MIGVHIAVPHTTVALLDLRGRVIAQRRDRHGRGGPADVLAAIVTRIEALRREHGRRRRILGLGLATGGWVDAATGTVVDHPVLGWRDVPAGAVLAEATGLPVRADSNSRALLRAEQLFGEVAARARESKRRAPRPAATPATSSCCPASCRSSATPRRRRASSTPSSTA